MRIVDNPERSTDRRVIEFFILMPAGDISHFLENLFVHVSSHFIATPAAARIEFDYIAISQRKSEIQYWFVPVRNMELVSFRLPPPSRRHATSFPLVTPCHTNLSHSNAAGICGIIEIDSFALQEVSER